MSKLIETTYEGRYSSNTKTAADTDPIKVDMKFSPVDLLMSSYASCILATVDFYARKKDFEVNGSRSELSYEMSAEGGKVGTINVKLFFDKEDYTAEQKEWMENSAKNLCHVGNSLNPAIVKNYEFTYGA
ncbi:OsmC family protein [Chryseobacterium sp. LC2016-29]|uniref:OsmC family protein n=1 Tax=Chryseobacterium sp. LC2016-29 TaxID=2897331 RepID=UPI001E2FC7AA|nr:OsmC family protein [Chryseobacterium sp. LC2016-29]MCD0477773.1 OsmC family protein [Chryseobacterium sp. LC2016-29]